VFDEVDSRKSSHFLARPFAARYAPAMFIVGTGTATLPQRYSQLECWKALQFSCHGTLLEVEYN
jgi:hypothetical protein